LLLFVLLLALGLGWFVPRWKAAREQQRARAAVNAMGGCAMYDYEYRFAQAERSGGAAGGSPAPPAPRWARTLLGDDFFADIVYVDYLVADVHGGAGSSELPPGFLGQIEKLPQLEVLELQDCSVSDDDMKHFEGLSHLTRLDLAYTLITDAGLSHLRGLSSPLKKGLERELQKSSNWNIVWPS